MTNLHVGGTKLAHYPGYKNTIPKCHSTTLYQVSSRPLGAMSVLVSVTVFALCPQLGPASGNLEHLNTLTQSSGHSTNPHGNRVVGVNDLIQEEENESKG